MREVVIYKIPDDEENSYFEVIDDGISNNAVAFNQWSIPPTIQEHLDSLQPKPDKIRYGNVPSEVSMRQARLALLQYGLLDDINNAIASLSGPQGAAAKIEWEYATSIKRDSPLVSNLAQALNLTDDILDELFTLAASL